MNEFLIEMYDQRNSSDVAEVIESCISTTMTPHSTSEAHSTVRTSSLSSLPLPTSSAKQARIMPHTEEHKFQQKSGITDEAKAGPLSSEAQSLGLFVLPSSSGI